MKKAIIVLTLFVGIIYGCSTNSNNTGGSTTTVVPVAPSNLTGNVLSSSSVSLSWVDNSTNESGFKIERRLNGATQFTVVGTVNPEITTFRDTNLLGNTSYEYRVYSFNAVGSSITYSNTITLITPADASINICNKIWSSQNLSVSHYRNGDLIPEVGSPPLWNSMTSGAWCWINNDSLNYWQYGKLYNRYAVEDPRGLAPQGWHIATDSEWELLKTCLGGSSIAGGAMKEVGTTHWLSPNIGATNSSGFTALPGGSRGGGLDGTFDYFGEEGDWWSFKDNPNTNPKMHRIFNNYINVNSVRVDTSIYQTPGGWTSSKATGCSVRLVKD